MFVLFQLRLVRTCLVLLAICLPFAAHAGSLSLQDALQTIRQNDLKLRQFQRLSQAYSSEAEAADYLPEPVLFAGIQNLPTDTFDLDQEPMTQLRMGLRQMFPKGDSLAIKSDLASLNADMQDFARNAYWLSLKRDAEQAWLEAWYWQKRLSLLIDDRRFLDQVLNFTQSLYEVGAKDQSAVLGAELALYKLQDTEIEARKQLRRFKQELDRLAQQPLADLSLSEELPNLDPLGAAQAAVGEFEAYFLAHPSIAILNQKIALSETKTGLLEQDFEPAWGLEVSYGLRDGTQPDGSERADFFSAGLSVQLPFFSRGQKQQSQQAETQRTSAAMLARDEALQDLRFRFSSVQQQYRNTTEQRELYEASILPTLSKQRQSALQSYESDKGTVQSVMDVFLAEQAAKAMHQRLRVDELKHLSALHYFLGFDSEADPE
ncbi:MAG: hypothetical protein C9356_18045 [Oleiphilus sp.]|nr:MAG: hypothetical protein C9356_18045 [Oleiphilus sp.]